MITARWTIPLGLLMLGAAGVCGCSETTPFAQLPDATKMPDKVLSKAEQQGKVQQMIEKGRNHRGEAVKEIEEDRDR